MKIFNSKLLAQHKNIIHAFTTRLDGNSLYGNNLAYHVNDDSRVVNKNHDQLAKYLIRTRNQRSHQVYLTSTLHL